MSKEEELINLINQVSDTNLQNRLRSALSDYSHSLMDKWVSDEEIENVFPTDNENSGDDDNSEELNHCNELRQEGAKWYRDKLLTP